MNKKRQAIIAALLVAVLVAVPVFAEVTGVTDASEVLAAEVEKLPDYFLDLSEGLKAETQYDGGITVGENMPVNNTTPAAFTIDGEDYVSGYTIQGANNPKNEGGQNANDTILPVNGAYVKVEAEDDGVFVVVTNQNGEKPVYFTEDNNGTAKNIGSFTTKKGVVEVHEYPVEKGKTYYFYASGSKVMIAGLGVKYDRFEEKLPEYFLDLSEGLKAETKYDGGITVGENMPVNNTTPAAFTIDGEDYVSGYTVQGANNPKNEGGQNANDTILPVNGAYVKIEAEDDGVFVVVTNQNGEKPVYFTEDNNGTAKNIGSFTTKKGVVEVHEYPVEKGKTYYFYASGSKVMIAGLGLKYNNTDDETFEAVTGITGVATEMTAGETITLSGTVAPENATNKTIVWSVKDAGTTGATIEDDKLTATSAGTVVITATIENGLTATTPYTQDFTIIVKAADDLKLGDVDGNGTVDVDDALAILKSKAKLKLDKFIAELADVDQDGVITADDALAILKTLVEMGE